MKKNNENIYIHIMFGRYALWYMKKLNEKVKVELIHIMFGRYALLVYEEEK